MLTNEHPFKTDKKVDQVEYKKATIEKNIFF